MAKYATLLDCADPAVTVTDQNLNDADVYVDLQLNARGFAVASIVLPNTTLTTIAVTWAKRLAAIEGAIGEKSPLIEKAVQLEKTAKTLVALLTRESLGLTNDTGAAFGQFTIGRG